MDVIVLLFYLNITVGFGCTDTNAINYDSLAIIDDGSFNINFFQNGQEINGY